MLERTIRTLNRKCTTSHLYQFGARRGYHMEEAPPLRATSYRHTVRLATDATKQSCRFSRKAFDDNPLGTQKSGPGILRDVAPVL